jgi:uncharacterized protein (TIGR00303 family)
LALKSLSNPDRYMEISTRLAMGEPLLLVTIGSTRTSTIPGVSIAGATPELTLTTPCLDVEYLVTGRPVSMDILPVTPTGIPTPALVTRGVVTAASIPVLVIDAGSYMAPAVPHISMPGRTVGGRIDVEPALPEGKAMELYKSGYRLGESIAGPGLTLILAESIPGGTTTALGILEGLGYDAYGKVSSAGPSNPHDLKRSIVEKALDKCRAKEACNDPLRIVEEMGDPVHITIAGIASGALDRGGAVVLSGGTQMTAVLALIDRLRGLKSGDALLMATTRWLVEDPSSDYKGLKEMISPDVPAVYYDYNFKDSPYEGLKAYEQGFVKEGVGIGGSAYAATVNRGLTSEAVHKAVYREYERVAREAGVL